MSRRRAIRAISALASTAVLFGAGSAAAVAAPAAHASASTVKVAASEYKFALSGTASAGPVTFDIDSAVKDLRTMLAEGKDRGVELPLVAQTLACYEETKRNVSGAAEVSAVSVYWANRAKP